MQPTIQNSKETPAFTNDLIQQLLQQAQTDFPDTKVIESSPAKSPSPQLPGELSLSDVENISQLKRNGQKYFKQGQVERALGFFERAYAEIPGDLELLFYQALCHYRLKQFDRAANILEQIRDLDDSRNIPAIDKWLPLTWLKQKKLREAEEFVDEKLLARPDDLQYLNMKAFVLERNGKLEEAEDILKRILGADPGNANALNSLAWVYYRRNTNLHVAIDMSKKALGQEPDNPSYLDTLAMLLKKEGNNAAARKALNKAINLDPTNQEILRHAQIMQ